MTYSDSCNNILIFLYDSRVEKKSNENTMAQKWDHPTMFIFAAMSTAQRQKGLLPFIYALYRFSFLL